LTPTRRWDAHGRYNRYRYYMCWTRNRYGTKAGCAIHRFSADELEAAVREALLDFYATQHDVITRLSPTLRQPTPVPPAATGINFAPPPGTSRTTPPPSTATSVRSSEGPSTIRTNPSRAG
jgi:hypothetical protein